MENPISLTTAGQAVPSVNSLPDEVLEMIFKFATGAGQAMALSTAMPDVPFALILTWVCHRWRLVTRDSSGLWTVLPLQALELLEMAIELSGVRRLSLHALPPNLPIIDLQHHVETLRVAFQQSNRIFELVIGHNDALVEQEDEDSVDELEERGSSEVDNTLDAQEEVHAQLSSFVPSTLQRFTASHVQMDSSLFSGTLPPLLTYLYLAFCDIASDCSGFRAPITFLTLIECGCLPSHDNISELMKILTLVHSTLERFVVHYLDGHLFAHLGVGDMQPIALPHLQYFEIVDVIYMVMNVLSSIIIPPTTELHITAFLPEDADEPAAYIEVLEELLRWLTNHFASTVAAGLCMRRVGIRFEDEDGTTVIGLSEPFEEAPIPGISAQNRPTRVVLTTNCILPTPVPAFNPTPTHHAITVVPQGQGIPLYDGAEPLLGANATQSTTNVIVSGLRPIFHGVPLVGTARIVDGEHPMLEYIENWRVISHSCVAVEEIVVRGVSAFGLVAFLAEANVVGAFPMLRSISILGVSFSHQSATGATFSQRFAQSLAAREANSIVLSVQACMVEEDMIVDLRSVAAIADIDWDGLTV